MAVTAPGTHDPVDDAVIPTAWGDAVNADLTSLDSRVTTAESKLTASAWVEPTPEAGWTNTGGGYEVVRYRKVAGVVYMEGLVTNTSGSSKAFGSLIFTLPAGLRPQATLTGFSLVGAFQVLANGRVENNTAIANSGLIGLTFSFYVG